MAGTDHWYGIKYTCPHGCGARWGGSIPEGHYIGCAGRPAPPTPERQAELNAEAARVREANAEQGRRIALGCDRELGADHDHDPLACWHVMEVARFRHLVKP